MIPANVLQDWAKMLDAATSWAIRGHTDLAENAVRMVQKEMQLHLAEIDAEKKESA